MLAAETPFLASAKKDGKDVHAHRVRFFLLHCSVILRVSSRVVN